MSNFENGSAINRGNLDATELSFHSVGHMSFTYRPREAKIAVKALGIVKKYCKTQR